MLALHAVGVHSLEQSLFLALNLAPQAPEAAVNLALFGSQWLPQVLLMVLALIAAVGKTAHRMAVLRTLLAMGLAWAVAHVLKQQIAAPRPFMLGLGTEWLSHSSGNGFPSSHAAVSMAFAVAMVCGPWRWPWRVAALLCGVLIAWSRIALGVHFPSDVLAAAALGSGCAMLVILTAMRMRAAPAARSASWPPRA